MGTNTAISWTDATWNCLRGCTRVSPGCEHCYAEVVAARFSGPGQPYEGLATRVNGHARWTNKVRFIELHLEDPLHWRRPRRVFVNSVSDLFHESLEMDIIARIFAVMMMAPRHEFQVLTKRPTQARDVLCDPVFRELVEGYAAAYGPLWSAAWPLGNIWIGVSVEDQQRADERIPLLLQTPAAVRFLSCEPLLGPVDVRPFIRHSVHCHRAHPLGGPCRCGPRVDWVIAGGESGPRYREMDLAWARSLQEQCRAADIAYFFKQDSGPRPGMRPDALGQVYQQFPAILGGA